MVVEEVTIAGWILAAISSLLAYYYYRQSRHAHQVQLEYTKAVQALEDDRRRTGERRGVIKWNPDGRPYIAWYRGAEPPPQER